MGIAQKLTSFARSPQGKKAMAQAQRMAKDPATKAKIADARKRFGSGKKRP